MVLLVEYGLDIEEWLNVKTAEVRSNDAALGIDTASPASGLVITSAVRWRAYGEN